MQCDLGEVHVWRIKLECEGVGFAALQVSLSPDERARAKRFYVPGLQRRWTVARGALRHILATYTQSDPRSLKFCVGRHGKPRLAGPADELFFNLTHTNDLALVAVTNTKRVGVDAEAISSGVNVEEMSRCFFAPAEADEILALPPEAQLPAFFATWTRKEAFVKALGGGLSIPLDQFRVSVRSEEPAMLISVGWDEPAQWSLVDLGQGQVAATAAVEGPTTPVVRRLDFIPALSPGFNPR